jgi:hypothetical protein
MECTRQKYRTACHSKRDLLGQQRPLAALRRKYLTCRAKFQLTRIIFKLIRAPIDRTGPSSVRQMSFSDPWSFCAACISQTQYHRSQRLRDTQAGADAVLKCVPRAPAHRQQNINGSPPHTPPQAQPTAYSPGAAPFTPGALGDQGVNWVISA